MTKDNILKTKRISEIILRIVLLIISCLMILWYLDSHFISLGSTAGTAFFAILGLCVIFWDFIRILSKKLLCKKWGKILIYGLMAFSCIIVLYIAAAVGLMIYGANRPFSEDATVVVLGCQVRGTRPSHALRCRLDTAVSYLNEHPSAKAVLSGGQGDNENISEAQCMFNYLTEAGISADRLYIEEKSTSTDENIRFSEKVIRENGLNKEIAVITDWYHEFRTSVICSRNGISSGSIPSPTPQYLTANLVTREIFAIPYELLLRR